MTEIMAEMTQYYWNDLIGQYYGCNSVILQEVCLIVLSAFYLVFA